MAQQLNNQDESWLAAAHLSDALQSGWRPAPIPSPIQLAEGELLYQHIPVTLAQYVGADVSYSQGMFLAAGGVGMLAATAAGSAMYNRHKRKQAERQAAAQWRGLDTGTLYVTNQRFACQLHQQWLDLWFGYLNTSECDGHGVILWYSGSPPTKLVVYHPEWLFLLFRFLAYGEVWPFVLDEDSRQRVLASIHR